MFNVGGGEMVLLAVLALLVFGPEGLPEIMKTVARTVKAFRQAANDFQSEVNTALIQENQKHQTEQRRRNRPRVIDPVQPATDSSLAAEPSQAAPDESGEPVREEGQIDAVPAQAASEADLPGGESTPAKHDVPAAQVAAGQVAAAAGADSDTGAVVTAPTEDQPNTNTEEMTSLEPLKADEDDDGPGLPMTRPARAQSEPESLPEPERGPESEPSPEAEDPTGEGESQPPGASLETPV